MSKHAAYVSWLHMRQRCIDPTSPDYPNYGARGITVCARWDDFSAFWADMGNAWRPGLSIDRRDNHGPYEPDNCRWATDFQQANNKRNNRFIWTPFGTMTLAQASRAYAVPYGRLKHYANAERLPEILPRMA